MKPYDPAADSDLALLPELVQIPCRLCNRPIARCVCASDVCKHDSVWRHAMADWVTILGISQEESDKIFLYRQKNLPEIRTDWEEFRNT